jgi:membrane protein
MSNQICKKKLSAVHAIYEWLLCLYIIIIPIINTLNSISILGYGIHIWIILLLLLTTLIINIIDTAGSKSRIGYPLVVLAIFSLEIILQRVRGEVFEIGLLLSVFLYIAFLKIPQQVSVKKIYLSFYISVIIAAICSIFLGLSFGEVSRTATKVDGSISIIAALIIFFGEESFNKTSTYEFFKKVAMGACFVVIAFGMSRSRLLILITLIFIKLLLMVKKIIATGRIKVIGLISFPIFVIILVVISQFEVTKNLFDAFLSRFENGLQSLGRTDEIEVGIQFFVDNPIFGVGWGELLFVDYQNYLSNYYNHCMYIAILARGGIIMAITFLISLCSIVKKAVKQKNLFCLIALLIFFALAYGNAGIFNYTICGMFIPLILNLRMKKTSITTKLDKFEVLNENCKKDFSIN